MFWLLTFPEFIALKRQWERERGIKPPLTREQRENYERNTAYILEQQRRARNKEIARQSAMKVVRRQNG